MNSNTTEWNLFYECILGQLQICQDWKKGGKVLPPHTRRYDPSPPPAESVDLEKFPLKMASISIDASKKGWSAYKIHLTNEIRAKHLGDPVNAPKWKELILDFDSKSFAFEFNHVERVFSNSGATSSFSQKTKSIIT